MLDRPDDRGRFPLVRVAVMVGNPVDLLFSRSLDAQMPLGQPEFHVERAAHLPARLDGVRKLSFVRFGATVPFEPDMPAAVRRHRPRQPTHRARAICGPSIAEGGAS